MVSEGTKCRGVSPDPELINRQVRRKVCVGQSMVPWAQGCWPSAPVRQQDSKLFLLDLSTKTLMFLTMLVSCVHLIWGDTHTVSEVLICNVASQTGW